MIHTSNERANETVLFAGMCARNYAKTESAITVQRAFRIKFGCQPPNDNNILRCFVKEKVRDDQGCNWPFKAQSAIWRIIKPTLTPIDPAFIPLMHKSSSARKTGVQMPRTEIAFRE
ncbi:hypothetical protein TNCV_2287691 [Trichonephila clavipes]|nr:hypothetical protein TNCV_2287691 [Trichonephila clavipes]